MKSRKAGTKVWLKIKVVRGARFAVCGLEIAVLHLEFEAQSAGRRAQSVESRAQGAGRSGRRLRLRLRLSILHLSFHIRFCMGRRQRAEGGRKS